MDNVAQLAKNTKRNERRCMVLLPTARREEIINILKTKDYAEISYLSQRFQVSEMTIRRDIEKLEKKDKVKRVYGGVRLKEIGERELESPIDERKSTNTREKQAIAKEAAAYIKDGDVIAFDASTTAYELSRYIKFKKKVTVVTNNINIAVELSDDPEITVILLGGFVRRTSLSLIGSSLSKYLESIFIDKAFISCKALNFSDGITDSLMDEGEAKQAIIKRSNQLFILADHSKIDTIAFFKICPADRVDALITDAFVPLTDGQKSCLELYRESGIDLIIAEPVPSQL
ncbi:DeoR/GlpR family DNA-binding transcription regulator [Virgibacillus sp. W0430]|uniref:DeoR/GlpR family DNA-binding transcription regulator n=1 Tax=Virgibacillus sp. W0430 TaxID=3391580 RepID=UPI003F455561